MEGEDCACAADNNILYGAITDEGKIDYMLGFAQDVASSDTTQCSDSVFGDPTPGVEKYCWCQNWISEEVAAALAAADATNATSTAQIIS